jgi:hypothetical protein
MSGLIKKLLSGPLMLLVAGCGASNPPTPTGNTITVTFTGNTPSAVATKFGGSAFAAATLQGAKTLSFVLPAGTTNYTLAYVCTSTNGALTEEFVLEASIQDSSSINRACPLDGNVPLPTLGAATGNIDATAIAGAASVSVFPPSQGQAVAVNGPFNVNLPVGMEDVAFAVLDTNNNILALRILRSQTVPGAINGGNPVIFSGADATTLQALTLGGVPAGFAGGPFVEYHTAGGTSIDLNFQSVNNSTSYAIVPRAAAQNGDFYLFIGTALSLPPSTFHQSMQIIQRTTTGGAVTLTSPAALVFAGPTPAALPTFNFSYSGFPLGIATGVQQARISWTPTATSRDSIIVTATPNFLGGATSLSVPDLSSLSGFLAPAISGTQVAWDVEIFGNAGQAFPAVTIPPANGLAGLVQNGGTYTQP